jgi:thiol:disulfide interchange protein DsbD
MVPVTVSYFSKRTDRPLAAALAYSLGIVATFAVLGVLVAALFGATKITAFAANPWVNVSLGLLFVVLALNLFGLYEVQVPFANKVAAASRSATGGLLVPMLMAVAFTLTSFTCTAPIVGTLLVLSAKGGNLAYPALGMASFGLAFALPFFFLALFPSAVSKMPKGGQWLGVVKPTLGFIELMAAMKFFSNADLAWQAGLLTRPVFLGTWALLLLGMGLYLSGRLRAKTKVGLVRGGFALLSILLGAYLLVGVTQPQNFGELASFLPPAQYPVKGKLGDPFATTTNGLKPDSSTVSRLAADPGTAKNFKEALALAKAKGVNVFVDFTGVTCVNCRKMEQTVFPVPEVKQELGKLVKVQLYTDRDTDEDNANQALEQKLGNTVALPLYLLVRPDGTVIDHFEGLGAATDFTTFLKKGTNGSAVAMR